MSESEVKPEVKSEGSDPTAKERQRTQSEGNDSNPDIHFDPIIELPLIDLKTLEENETEILKLRAKLYRYDTSEEVPQFKERGTGDVKVMRHNNLRAVRILMRRDKTLKLCANHYIMPSMELKKHNNSEKVFVWSTFADLSEESAKPETLAIRFGNTENAQKFKEVFDESLKYVSEDVYNSLSNDISNITIKDDQNSDKEEEDSDDNESDDKEDKENREDREEEENKAKDEKKEQNNEK